MKIKHMATLLVALMVVMPVGPIMVLAASTLVSPVPMQSLAQSLEAYRQANLKTDVDGILSFVYPAVFTIVPRQSLKELLTEVYSGKNGPRIRGFEFAQIGAAQTYSKGEFASINYTLEIELPHPGDATPDMDAAIIGVLKAKMGPETKIVIDEKRKVINVKKPSVMLAINANKSGWKVLEREYMDMLRQSNMLPEDLFAKLK